MNSVRIALDANEANVKNRVGSNIYAFGLLCELESQTRNQSDFSFVVYLSQAPQPDFPKTRAGWKYRILTPVSFWTQWRFPIELLLRVRSFDLVLSLGHYAPRFSLIPSVICILDLAFLQFPQFFRRKDLWQLTHWTAYSAKQAKHIVTISESSKLDIVKAYGRGPEEISIVYPGARLPDLKSDKTGDLEVLSEYKLSPESYLVCVGTIQPRKNLINLIHAFETSKQCEQMKLVFVGKSGWLTSEFEETIAMSGAKDRIVVTGFVTEAVKYALLRQAKASILVGFYEGFGIPAIEGLGVGIAPVFANTGSLPEVVGNLGVSVDPYSITDISRGLDLACQRKTNASRAQEMVKRSQEFTWKTSGSNMLKILKEVAK